MTDAMVTKLNGIATGANKYTHPSTHPATMIAGDTTHRFVTDTEKAAWNAKASTAVATTSTNGLMSAADKTKLDSIPSTISDAWNSSTTYAVGEYCIYNNALWKCLVGNANTQPSEGTYWTKVNVGNELASRRKEITELNSNLTNLKPVQYTYPNVAVGVTYTAYRNNGTKEMDISACYERNTVSVSPSEIIILNSTFKPLKTVYFSVSAWDTATGSQCLSYGKVSTDGNISVYQPKGVVFTCYFQTRFVYQ